MSDVQPLLLQAAQALLRPREQIEYLGVLSHRVPPTAVFLPVIARLYAGHFLVAVTTERLIFFPTGFGLLGGVSAPSGRASSIELADVRRIDSFQPVVPYGHQGIRLTLQAGFEHELVYPSSIRGLDAHTAFAAGFAGTLARRLDARDVVSRTPDERNVPAFQPRPAVFTFLLVLFGGLLSVGSLFPLFLMILGAPLEILALALLMLLVGLPMLVAGVALRRQRARLMGLEQTPLRTLVEKHGRKGAIGCVVAGLVLGVCGLGMGGLLAYDAYTREVRAAEMQAAQQERAAREADEARTRMADEARFPAHGEWAPEGVFTLPVLPGPIPGAAETRARFEELGFRVTEVPPSAREGAAHAWSLELVGDGGQTITLRAVTGESDAETSRSQQARSIYTVRGPDAAVRARTLGHLSEGRCSSFALQRCAELAGARRPTCTGDRCSFEVGGEPYSLELLRMPERGRRGPGRIRGPLCVGAPAGASFGWLCVEVRLAPNPNDDRPGAPDRDQTWSEWAIHTVVQPR